MGIPAYPYAVIMWRRCEVGRSGQRALRYPGATEGTRWRLLLGPRRRCGGRILKG